MVRLMKKEIKFRVLVITAILITILIACFIISIELKTLEQQTVSKQTIRFNSFVIANELRQSSEDLTTLARSFVATGDPKFEQQYNDILNWRSGKTPRPATFALHPGETINQVDIMKELGFSDEELEKLKEATKNSNALVATETKAMNAIHGLEPDGKTSYKGEEPAEKMALRIMFDEKYHADKAIIMNPIDEFFTLLDERTLENTTSAKNQMDLLSNILSILIIISGLIFLFLAWYVIRIIISSLLTVEKNLERISLGDLEVTWETSREDEIGKMAQAFSKMVEGLRQKTSVAQAISEGNLSVDVRALSDKDTLGASMITMKNTIINLVEEVNHVNARMVNGEVGARADTSRFSGEFEKMAKGINILLETINVPLNEAMRLAGSYAKGDFTDRVNNQIAMKGDFVAFKEALNQIGIQSGTAIGGVKTEVESLSAGMEETNASAEEVASTTSMLARSSGEVSILAERSGNGIKQTLTAMEDLSNTVSSVAGKAEQASDMAKQTVDLSEKGVMLAEKAEKGMEGIMQSAEETRGIISDITGQMEEIGKIVDVITGIAEQTGLLALNAAIEAARAGDAGLGFAVVADEVKSLALESQKSAENIATIIGNLQKKSDLVTESMNSSATEVKAGNDAVTDTLKIFDEIAQAINAVHANMTEVAGATEEQAAVVEEITASVNEVGSLVQQTAKEAVDSAAATEEVTASIDQIRRAITDAASSVQRISENMGKFAT